ncbi:MAG: glycosyl hydrolase family 28 protein [Terriglobia bacterium]
MNPSTQLKFSWCLFLVLLSCPARILQAGQAVIFNVKDYGATGAKADDAGLAIQKAIDACGAGGGGEVYLPPGEYTSGTLYLRSHVRLYLEAGATLFASQDPMAFNGQPMPSKASLIFGENLEDISIEGRGTVNGQAVYEWRADDIEDVFLREAKRLMLAQGKSILRPFPKGHPARTIFPHLVWLGDSKNIRITGVSFIDSPSWTMAFHACEQIVIDGIYMRTKLDEAVWADGIDFDGCKEARIANSTIETGDDCIVFISGDFWGPPRICENITVTNCRLSSSANAIKFSEGNVKGVRNVVVDNCVISDDSSGFAFLASDGGFVSDVVISNITMELRRFGWYYGQGGPMGFALKRRDEWTGKAIQKEGPIPGVIRNVAIRNLIIHAKGRCHVDGHPSSWIDGLTLENIRIFLATDPEAPFDRVTNAMQFRWVKNLKLKDVEIQWEKPASQKWQSALFFEDIQDLEIDGFRGRQAWPEREEPAVMFKNVANAIVRNSRGTEGTNLFLRVSGEGSGEIVLTDNDFRKVKIPFQMDKEVKSSAVTSVHNIGP